MSFTQLGVMAPIAKALEAQKYYKPTEIQQKSIPLALKRRDLLATAQTGTGKTAAFAVPIIQLIEKIEKAKGSAPVIRSLILTPTRELAIQIDESIAAYNENTRIRHTVIFGGVSQHKQVQKLKKGVDILVATPGRLLDLIDQGYISLSTVKIFVLDEADRMLDMGFIHDIRKIIPMLPKKRQTLFFSATMPNDIKRLSKDILTDPVYVEADVVSSAADTVRQMVFYTNKKTKKDLLLDLIEDYDMDQVLLFARTKRGADKIARFLHKKGIKALAIHGDKAQNNRQRTLNNFKDGKVRVLVATDIAARGIDIDKLNFVINFDIPNVPETYVHRIGRTGRAGESGLAISISEPEENAFIRDIEKLIKNKIEVGDSGDYPQTDKPMTAAEKKAWNKEKQRRKNEFHRKRRAAKMAR